MSVSRGEPPTKRIKLEEEEEEANVVTSEIEYAATSSLCSLPNEMLIKILLYLDTRDKIRTKLVNRRMYGVVDDSILWQHVEINDAYRKKNISYVKSLLRICQPHVKSLCISEGITIPFSRQYQSLVIGFKNVEELVLNGFDVTGRALQTLATGLPHLSSLTLSCTSTTSFNSTIEQIPSLRYLNKLSLYIDESLSRMEYYTRLVDAWYDAECYPNLLYLFCSYFSYLLPPFRKPPSIPHNASLVFYFRYRRPLNLQFNLRPAFHLQLGPGHKDQEVACTASNKSLNIKVMDCHSPEINTKLRTYKVGVLSSNYPWGPALGNATIPFCLSIGCNLAFLDFTCIPTHDELSVDQLIDVLRFTPNLVEFTLSGMTGDIIELIHALVQYCKFLKGLNLSMCLVNVDKLDLWRALSSISRLQYLTISMCSFSPPLTVAQATSGSTQLVYELDNLVKDQMCSIFKQMIMLKALHVNLICIHVDSHWTLRLQLLQQCLLKMISNMTNLHYLKLSNKEFQCDQELSGLEDVLQNCTQLRVLYVHTRVLCLPSNPNLYANLTHLYISCIKLSKDKFIDFKKDGKFSLKHFVLIASRISFPDLMKFLNSCAADLYTCHIVLGRLRRMQRTRIRSILSNICVTPFYFEQFCYSAGSINSFNADNTDFDDLFCY